MNKITLKPKINRFYTDDLDLDLDTLQLGLHLWFAFWFSYFIVEE